MSHRIVGMKGDSVLEAKGVNGQVYFEGDIVRISRKGALAFMTQGLKGDKEIHVAQVSAVQYKKAGLATNGFIQFSFVGGHETKAGLFNATQDENTVMFNMGQAKNFLAIKEAVQARVNEIHSARATPAPQASGSPDPFSQIQQLGTLRDQGLITQDEFDAKKRELLGLSASTSVAAADPPAPPAPLVEGWQADPTGRHELRYCDGNKWTEHVADAGVQAVDAV